MDQKRDQSKVDLGEDLLEKIDHGGGTSTSSSRGGSLEESFHSAQILLQEGFRADAKRELRQILMRDPGFLEAQKLLDQMNEAELKSVLEGHSLSSRSGHSVTSEEAWDAEVLMRRLDAELELGIFTDAPPSVKLSQFSMFQDQTLLQEYVESLEKELAQAEPKDWIDLGIGFLEMELSSIAIRLFAGAQKRAEKSEEALSRDLLLSATSLLALTLLQEGKPYEAFSQLQPLLHDLDISIEKKVELYYLVGRSFEAMRKFEMAQEFYSQVIKIDPKYRDTSNRLHKDRMS